MTKDLNEIQEFFIQLLKKQGDVFKVTAEEPGKFEVSGTVEAMQGKKKVDGMYFATVAPKPKDIRFYFFPLYTHREQLESELSERLKKCLKGKTCFHVKALTEDLSKEFESLVSKSVGLYQADGLLAK